MIVNQAMRPLAAAFEKRYPFVRLTYWRADTEDIVQKVAAEIRAGNIVAYVVEGMSRGPEPGSKPPAPASCSRSIHPSLPPTRRSMSIRRSVGIDPDQLLQRRLQYRVDPARADAEDLRGAARPAL